ncbi:MAG: hypothetical protein GEU91_01770 [Rhizobiales bacterium]|nr:hypothetical protein [Hyphomicrobiales bacterium]
MTVIRPERLGDISEKVAEFEGELQDVVRKNVTYWRKPQDGGSDGSEGISVVIQRVAGASLDEIDLVIGQLESMREKLRREGERVQREIAGYAELSQSAMSSVKIIAESLGRWEQPADQLPEAG